MRVKRPHVLLELALELLAARTVGLEAQREDFDDALSFKILDNNVFEVGVHIADVSSYVKPDTELDKEARKRGTSVYLANKVIGMLPEMTPSEIQDDIFVRC